jgi:hypothetical protein
LLKDLHWLISFFPPIPTDRRSSEATATTLARPSHTSTFSCSRQLHHLAVNAGASLVFAVLLPNRPGSRALRTLRPVLCCGRRHPINSPYPPGLVAPFRHFPLLAPPTNRFRPLFPFSRRPLSRRCVPRSYALLIMAGYVSALPLVAVMPATDHGPAPD